MPKITIDLPADANEKLKKKAKEDYRSLTNYITVALINLANDTLPGMSSTPSTYPDNTNTMSIPTEINGVQVKGVQFATKKQEKELSPIEQQIQQNKLKEQRYKWIEKTIDRLHPGARKFYGEQHFQELLAVNQEHYWNRPDEDFIKHIQDLRAEDEYFEAHPELLEDNDEDEVDTTPHSPEYLKIKNYFANHGEPYEFEDVTNHARLAKEGNENSIEYIKDYYDINLHDALGSPHSYDFSDEQWTELFNILSE